MSATETRPNLERLADLAARLTADRDQALAKIPELKEQEMTLRREAIRQDPDRRSTWKGAVGEANQIKLKRTKLEDSIPALDEELALVASELEVERDKVAQATFAEALDGIAEFDERELVLIDLLEQAHAAFVEQFGVLRQLRSERRDFAGRFTLSTQGMANQLRTAVESEWNPVSAEDAFAHLTDKAKAAAEAVPDVQVSFNPDQFEGGPSEADWVQHYNLIQRAQNLGVTTQELPQLPGQPPTVAEPEPVAAPTGDEAGEVEAEPITAGNTGHVSDVGGVAERTARRYKAHQAFQAIRGKREGEQ